MIYLAHMGDTLHLVAAASTHSSTSKMMIHHCHGASLSEQCTADLMYVMAHKPCITAGFVTVCCYTSVASKNSFSQARVLTRHR